jgi:hypothetical protein
MAATAALAGVQLGVSYISGTMKAHAARAAGAKNENAAMNFFIQGFDLCIKKIFELANKGLVTGNESISLVQVLEQEWRQSIDPYQHGPGQASHICNPLEPSKYPAGMMQWGTTACDKTCTATCCVTCDIVDVAMANATYVFSHGGGKCTVPPVFGNKYGGQARASYVLTYQKPRIINAQVATVNINTGQVLTGHAAIVASVQEGTPLVKPSGEIISPEQVAHGDLGGGEGLDGLVAGFPGGAMGLGAAILLITVVAMGRR